jgi:hypothetical protein
MKSSHVPTILGSTVAADPPGGKGNGDDQRMSSLAQGAVIVAQLLPPAD